MGKIPRWVKENWTSNLTWTHSCVNQELFNNGLQ